MLKNYFLLMSLVFALYLQSCITPKKTVYHSDKPVFMMILDTSGSMKFKDGKQKRIDRAKMTISDYMSRFDSEKQNTGLIIYEKCTPKVIVNPSNNNANNILDAIQNMKAYGATPLAASIRYGGEMLESIEEKHLLLISNGADSCGGDPLYEAQKIYKKYGIKIDLDIVGYGVNEEQKKVLKKISEISPKWNYYDAKDAGEFSKVGEELLFDNNLQSSSWKSPTKFSFQFSFNSKDLSPYELGEAKKMYHYLQGNNKHIEIVGHTDNKGTKEQNQVFSMKRAESIKNKLIELGINSNRIVISGKGEGEPIADNSTEVGRKENRRVEINIK